MELRSSSYGLDMRYGELAVGVTFPVVFRRFFLPST